MTSEQAWQALIRWSEQFDERDLTDAARAWANEEALAVAMPENTGAWKASLEMAFEAGRQLERFERADHIWRT